MDHMRISGTEPYVGLNEDLRHVNVILLTLHLGSRGYPNFEGILLKHTCKLTGKETKNKNKQTKTKQNKK